jgi:serine/threonine protein kinase/WD40 repeat protein
MTEDSDRDPLERVIDEFLVVARSGSPEVEAFIADHPEVAGELRSLLAVVCALEIAEVRPITRDAAMATPPSDGTRDSDQPHTIVPDLLPQIAGYRILRPLGQGGMGIVYEAVQLELGRRVAIKFLSDRAIGNTHGNQRFRLECQALARLSHPCIVPAHDFGTAHGMNYYVMQLIDGVPWGSDVAIQPADATREASSDVDRESPQQNADAQQIRQIAWIGEQIADALAHAHERGVLHRDIKPSNILIDRDGHPWLTDFGLAKMEGAESLTETNAILGTLRFLAPERLEGWSDARSDVYALGVTIYELLAKRPIHPATQRSALMQQILYRDPIPLRRCCAQIPRDLETIVMTAIAKDPASRYLSAERMAADLARFRQQLPISARQSGYGERARRWVLRNRTVSALGAVAMLSLLLALGVLTWSNRAQRKINHDLQSALITRNQALETAATDRNLARQAARRSAREAGQLAVQRGVQAGEEEEFGKAALWIAEATKLAGDEQDFQEENRYRFAAYASGSVVPVAHFQHETARDQLDAPTLLPDDHWVQQLCFSSDNSRLISTTVDGERRSSSLAVIWRIAQRAAEDLSSCLPGKLTAACWAEADAQVWVANQDGDLMLVELGVDAPAAIYHAKLEQPAIGLQYSPSRKLLLARSPSTVTLWRVDGGLEEIGTEDFSEPLWTTEISPVNDQWFAVTLQGTLSLYSVSGHEQRRHRTLKGLLTSKTDLQDLAVEPMLPRYDRRGDTIYLVLAETPKLTAWNWKTRATRTLADLTRGMAGLDVNGKWYCESQDSQWQIAQTSNNSILGWGTLNARQFLCAFACDEGSTMLAMGGTDRLLRVTQLPTGQPTGLETQVTLAHSTSLTSVAFSTDGELLASAERQGMIHIWAVNRRSIPIQNVWLPEHENLASGFTEASLSEAGDLLAVTGTTFLNNQVTCIQVAEAATGRAVGGQLTPGGRVLDAAFCGNDQRIAALTVTHDRSHTGPVPGSLVLLDWKSSQVLKRVAFPTEPRSVQRRPGSSELAVLCSDGTVHFIDDQTAETLRTWQAQPSEFIHYWYTNNGTLEFSPDGQLFVVYGAGNAARLWHAESGMALAEIQHSGRVNDACFSPSGRYLATVGWGQNELHVTDVQSGQPAAQPVLHPDWVFSVDFHPQEDRVITTCRDGSARVWDWRGGKQIGRSMPHPDETHQARFIRDGRWILTVCFDGSVRIWNSDSGLAISPRLDLFQRSSDAALTITLTPDQRYGVIGGLRQRVAIMSLEPETWWTTDLFPSAQLWAERASGERIEQGSESRLNSTELLERESRFHDLPFASSMMQASAARSYHWRQTRTRLALDSVFSTTDSLVWNIEQQLQVGSAWENVAEINRIWAAAAWSEEDRQGFKAELAAIARRLLIPDLITSLSDRPHFTRIHECWGELLVSQQLSTDQQTILRQVILDAIQKRELSDVDASWWNAVSALRVANLDEAERILVTQRRHGDFTWSHLVAEALLELQRGNVPRSRELLTVATRWASDVPAPWNKTDGLRWKLVKEIVGQDSNCKPNFTIPSRRELADPILDGELLNELRSAGPSIVDTRQRLMFYLAMRCWPEAIQAAEAAEQTPDMFQRPPARPWIGMQGLAALAADDQARLQHVCQRLSDMDQIQASHPWSTWCQAMSDGSARDLDAATAVLAMHKQETGDMPLSHIPLPFVLLRQQDPSAALAIVKQWTAPRSTVILMEVRTTRFMQLLQKIATAIALWDLGKADESRAMRPEIELLMAQATSLLEPQIDVSQPILEIIASFWYEAFLTRISDDGSTELVPCSVFRLPSSPQRMGPCLIVRNKFRTT